MKNFIIKTALLAGLVLLIAAGGGCRKDDMRIFKNNPSEESQAVAGKSVPATGIDNFVGQMDLLLKSRGNPGFGAVDVTIQGVAIHYMDEKVGDAGWITLRAKPRTVNMMMYQTGALTLGTSASLPLGVIDEVRVTFGYPNYLIWGNSEGRFKVDMTLEKTMSRATVGLHLPVDLHRKMIVTVGFDGIKSVTQGEAGQYAFTPTLFLEGIKYQTENPNE